MWLKYPKQIESGLCTEYPGLDIGQWHRGEMSSRKLIVLIEGLSGDSWFKQSLNADLKEAAAQRRREQMAESAADFEGRLRGEIRDPWDMTVGLVEKHALTEE